MKFERMLIFCLSCFLLVACQSTPKTKKDPNFVAYNPKASELNVQLGLAYLNQGDMDRAKSKLLYALKQDPNSPLALGSMAYYLEVTDDVGNAEVYHLRALTLAPQDGRTLNNYGTFLCRQRRYEAAEKYLLRAAQDINYLSVSEAYENAGLCAKSVADIDKAYYYFKKALSKNPNRLATLEQVLNIQVRKKHYLSAQKYYERYAKLKGESALGLWFAVKIYQGLGDEMEAESYRKKLASAYPDSKEAKLLKV